MKLVILLGAPGSGKGTVAERVEETSGYVHVSTGDMLREAVKAGTEVGLNARGYMERGELVPDDVMIKVIEERMDAGGEDAAYMFDGYPRTVAQAELLEKSLAGRGGVLEKVVFLDSPREVLIRRLTGRRVCRDCGACFHITTMQPKKEGVCDACGGDLYQRPDDEEETIANRLDVYDRQTESLVSRYENQGVLVKVDSDQQVAPLVKEVAELLESGTDAAGAQ